MTKKNLGQQLGLDFFSRYLWGPTVVCSIKQHPHGCTHTSTKVGNLDDDMFGRQAD